MSNTPNTPFAALSPQKRRREDNQDVPYKRPTADGYRVGRDINRQDARYVGPRRESTESAAQQKDPPAQTPEDFASYFSSLPATIRNYAITVCLNIMSSPLWPYILTYGQNPSPYAPRAPTGMPPRHKVPSSTFDMRSNDWVARNGELAQFRRPLAAMPASNGPPKTMLGRKETQIATPVQDEPPKMMSARSQPPNSTAVWPLQFKEYQPKTKQATQASSRGSRTTQHQNSGHLTGAVHQEGVTALHLRQKQPLTTREVSHSQQPRQKSSTSSHATAQTDLAASQWPSQRNLAHQVAPQQPHRIHDADQTVANRPEPHTVQWKRPQSRVENVSYQQRATAMQCLDSTSIDAEQALPAYSDNVTRQFVQVAPQGQKTTTK
jgi:hypothetical protein